MFPLNPNGFSVTLNYQKVSAISRSTECSENTYPQIANLEYTRLRKSPKLRLISGCSLQLQFDIIPRVGREHHFWLICVPITQFTPGDNIPCIICIYSEIHVNAFEKQCCISTTCVRFYNACTIIFWKFKTVVLIPCIANYKIIITCCSIVLFIVIVAGFGKHMECSYITHTRD